MGKPDFSALMIGPVAIGKFLNAVVNFLVVGTAIYFLVVLPMMRFQKKKEAHLLLRSRPKKSSSCGPSWKSSSRGLKGIQGGNKGRYIELLFHLRSWGMLSL
jgi:hypothetical protein